ncbi:MAG: hypothetical protein WD097_08085 [Balneolales bacterium]
MTHDLPLTSCLMISDGRREYTARAIYCFQQQNWPCKELVIIDRGEEDLSPLLEDVPASELRYIRRPQDVSNKDASLKNFGLSHTTGRFVANWKETDWYHPDRLRCQAEILMQGFNACWMSVAILHLDHPEYVHHPYIDFPSGGYAESLMFRKMDKVRYPDNSKYPDSALLSALLSEWGESECKQLDATYDRLIVRSLEGDTKSKNYKKFLSGYRNRIVDMALWAWLRIRGRSKVSHNRFKLSPEARASFQQYLNESHRLGIIKSVS